MMARICRLRRLSGAAIAAGGLALALATGALAGPIVDKASEVETRIASGDPAGALAAFDQWAEAFWVASPLQFRVALFAEAITAFGKYEPLANVTFHAGDTANIYLEPVGYGFAADGDAFRVTYRTGIEIRTPGGLILGKTDDFGKLEWRGRAKSREVHAAVSVGLPELKPGDYQLILTLNDEASGKSATTTLPFAIAE